MKLAELIERFDLYGVCIDCRRMEPLDLAAIVAAWGGQLDIETVRARVRCSQCKRRTRDIRIVYSGTCGHARGFHYRD